MQESISCRTNSIGYELKCKHCKEKKEETIYVGETGENGTVRGKNHLHDFRRGIQGSAMLKHMKEKHPKRRCQKTFEMKIIKRFKTPLDRQTDEGIRMKHCKGKNS